MLLLSPDDIKTDRTASADETRKRNQALAIEESRLARELNIIRASAEEEKARISKEMELFHVEQSEKREALVREVDALEAKRIDVLKPIEEIKKSAEEKMVVATAKFEEAERKKRDFLETSKITKENLQDEAEDLADRKADLDEREQKISGIEKGLSDEAARVKQSSIALAEDWVKYHQAVYKFNEEMDRRETAVRQSEIGTATIREAMEKRAREQDERDRGIRDKYATLQTAINEFEKQKNNLK